MQAAGGKKNFSVAHGDSRRLRDAVRPGCEDQTLGCASEMQRGRGFTGHGGYSGAGAAGRARRAGVRGGGRERVDCVAASEIAAT